MFNGGVAYTGGNYNHNTFIKMKLRNKYYIKLLKNNKMIVNPNICRAMFTEKR